MLRLAALLLREHWVRPDLQRIPEPQVMDQCESVEAFNRQGRRTGALVPVYHFNALALSRLLPLGGSLLDLGSGSGQFLIYLARCRPDLRITGTDLSPEMVRLGREELRRAGVQERVRLLEADMTAPERLTSARADLVSSIYSLHHLPSLEDLQACLAGIGRLRRAQGCGVWIYDHAPARRRRSADDFPEIFTPQAPAVFRKNSRDSVLAAFPYPQLCRILDRELGGGPAADGCPETATRPAHALARWVPLFQAHWIAGAKQGAHEAWKGGALSGVAAGALRVLGHFFPSVAR